MLEIKNNTLPDELKEVILSGKCVAFIGSGLSAGSYDSWPDLINGLCERCGITCQLNKNSPPDDFLDAAQDAKQNSETAYLEYLGEHFGRTVNQIQFIYDILLSVKFECYLTVNFDPHLLLKARIAWGEKNFKIHAYPNLDRKAMTKRSIHYLHGIIMENKIPKDGSIVLARNEFNEAYAPNSNLMNLLISTLENDPVLFIGCKLKEPVMPRVFNICKDNQLKRLRLLSLKNNPNPLPPKFILLPKPSPKEVEMNEFDENERQNEMDKINKYYEYMGIKSVWYDAAGNDHSVLRVALEALAKFPNIEIDYGW